VSSLSSEKKNEIFVKKWHDKLVLLLFDIITCILTASVMEVTSGPRGLSTVSLEIVKEHSLSNGAVLQNISMSHTHTSPILSKQSIRSIYIYYLGTQLGGVLSTSQAAKRLIGMSEG